MIDLSAWTHPAHAQKPKGPLSRGQAREGSSEPPWARASSSEDSARGRLSHGDNLTAQLRGWCFRSVLGNTRVHWQGPLQTTFGGDARAKRSPGSTEQSRQREHTVPTKRRTPGGPSKRVPEGPHPSTTVSGTHPTVRSSVHTRVCSWKPRGRLSQHCTPAATATRGPPVPCLHSAAVHKGAPGAHLDVAIVGPSVAIHALHRGRLPLHQVDPEQGLESHWVVHMRVVGRQVHPANDEQAVHLR